jgi:hypothetical protein
MAHAVTLGIGEIATLRTIPVLLAIAVLIGLVMRPLFVRQFAQKTD